MNRVTRRRFLAAGTAGLGTLAYGPRLSSATDWSDVRQSGPFTFRATFPLEEYDSLLEELPELERELKRVLAVRPPRKPIEVLLLADRLDYRRYLAANYPKVPYRRALFVKQAGEAKVFAYRQPELDIDLRHECTHALLHSDLEMVPLWLDEGIAEYFEAPQGERAFAHPHFRTLRWNMRLGLVRPIESLEENHDLSEMSGLDYRFSWAWTHFMLHGPEAAYDELIGFLQDIRRGTPPGKMSSRMASIMPDATKKMVQHFKTWKQPEILAG